MPSYSSTHSGSEIDNTVDQAVLHSEILNLIYPVGSIYLSVNSTDPSTFIGGTWERIQDTFLLGAGSTYTAGGTGGSANHTHTMTHTHTMAHTHTEGDLAAAIGASNSDAGSLSYQASNRNPRGPATVTSYTFTGHAWTTASRSYNHHTPVYGTTSGSSAANTGAASNSTTSSGSNLPPYLAVYIWKRVA